MTENIEYLLRMVPGLSQEKAESLLHETSPCHYFLVNMIAWGLSHQEDSHLDHLFRDCLLLVGSVELQGQSFTGEKEGDDEIGFLEDQSLLLLWNPSTQTDNLAIANFLIESALKSRLAILRALKHLLCCLLEVHFGHPDIANHIALQSHSTRFHSNLGSKILRDYVISNYIDVYAKARVLFESETDGKFACPATCPFPMEILLDEDRFFLAYHLISEQRSEDELCKSLSYYKFYRG